MEAEQHPTAPSTTKQLTVNILQHFYRLINQAMDYLEVNPDVEQSGLSSCRVMSDLAHYEHLLYDKRREATQATLDAFFSLVSLPEASASAEPHNREEPHTSEELPTCDKHLARDESQPNVSTGSFICPNIILLPSSSDVDDPGIVSFVPSSSNPPALQPQQAKTSGHFWCV